MTRGKFLAWFLGVFGISWAGDVSFKLGEIYPESIPSKFLTDTNAWYLKPHPIPGKVHRFSYHVPLREILENPNFRISRHLRRTLIGSVNGSKL